MSDWQGMIYLDHNATTPMYPEVRQALCQFLNTPWANPSSVHKMGLKARELREEGRRRVAKLLGASPGEIVFTSGGTEANCLALFGVARAYRERGRHIISTQIEHPSVYRPLERLREEGFEITFLTPNRQGIVEVEKVEKALRDDTILVSVMTANNETGALQPVKEIGELLSEHPAIFHTDGVQALGKIPLSVQDLSVDLLSLSGHKIGGPPGVGVLFVRQGVKLEPLLFGGGQEKGWRSGTENLMGIVGLAEAVKWVERDLQKSETLSQLRRELAEGIQEIYPRAKIHTPLERSLPNTLSVAFAGQDAQRLLLQLSQQGICVSAGSACSSAVPKPSRVLLSMGVSKELALSTLRFSLGYYTCSEDIPKTLKALKKILS